MLTNYIKIAWRNLVRNRLFSAINIVGLALGLATCLLILVYVLHELSYDRFNDKADRTVRVFFRGSVQGNQMNEPHVMPPVAQALHSEFPEVEEATRLRMGGSPLISYQDKTFKESAFTFADSNFFQVFSIPFLKGDAKTALLQPNTVVVTQKFAHKYFGSDDPIGKIITLKTENNAYKITGLVDKIPSNSHFDFDLFASMASLPEAKSSSWLQSEFFTYIVLPKGYDYKQLEVKLPQIIEKYMGPQLPQAMGMSLAQFHQKGNELSLLLQPLTDIHLHSTFSYDLKPLGNIRYVYLFGAIALFMLLIACINFMNLSTASATKRAREVGVRKVMGSSQPALIGQFMIESLLLTTVALALSTSIVRLVLPTFRAFVGQELPLDFLGDYWLWGGLCGIGLLTGVVAGSYPAFFLSSFKPVVVLKGGPAFRGGPSGWLPMGKGAGLRSSLVVFQFVISITLIVATTVVYQQLMYMQHKPLGYDNDQVIVLPQTWQLGSKEALLRDQLRQDPRIVNVSLSGFLPAGQSYGNNFFVSPDNNQAQIVKSLRYDVDENYIPTLGMKLQLGRNFSRDFSTDSSAIIVNEAAARSFGWGNNALKHTLKHILSNSKDTQKTYQVVGVVKDFHFRPLHERITPLVMVLGNNAGTLIVKAKTPDMAGLLASMEQKWKTLMPNEPFVYSFLGERYQNSYATELKTGQILGFFSGLTILVACLGLFGLVSFTTEQRTKEIGVRKVLGASITSIVGLLSKDFLKLVTIAIVLASPVAWWTMNRWLQDFAYKIDIDWWMLALAGALAVGIALLTVSFQSIRAALMNPVKSLRSE
ncbi:FtsX-like permease family protein [Spirosoma sp. HMF4905]|uniref:FtsX-like permease family protein n=1 Tax=Spirosoma arboris TaxID=2682092 RepID=A0A7K1SGX0_9BACT|nr:ABC transporter permease [Spirosoma arboris]MVM33060.1 FtsX-like permease family protein [Spirosoma arboris]